MDLKDLRNEIDEIDDELVKLFAKRMDVATRIADVKKEKSLPIFVPAREREKLVDVAEKAGPEMANYIRVLYSMLFELSRSHQNKLNGNISPLYQQITEAIENTPKLFPQAPMVACRVWRVPTPRLPARRSSNPPSSCTSVILRAFSLQSTRVCASTASCPWKTLPQAP